NQMAFKRVFMPMLVLGILLALSSVAFGQPLTVECGLSVPLGPTGRGTSTGHTEPIGAGPDGTAGSTAGGATNPGGGDLRVTCTNTSGATLNPTTATTAANPVIGLAVLTISFGAPITNSTSHPGAPNTAPSVRIEFPTT